MTAALSSGRGYRIQGLLYTISYALPASLIWGLVGAAIQPLSGASLIVALATFCYALGFGICEVLKIPFRPPSSFWQVPHGWLRGRSTIAQTLIWGVCLGPGLITRNPYAGIWILPLLLALIPNHIAAISIGVAIGMAHGCSRALSILRLRKTVGVDCTPTLVLQLWRWQTIDGIILLFIAGGLIIDIILTIR